MTSRATILRPEARLRSRRLGLLVLALALAPGFAALAGDEAASDKGEKKKTDLVYRWDLLDGKTAVYDVTYVTSGMRETKIMVDTEGHSENDREAANAEMLTYRSTQKSRVLVSFARAERDRGRVTTATERFQLTWTQAGGDRVDVSFTYDSANPPKEELPRLFDKTVESLREASKPFTALVSRRGLVEQVEGRQNALEEVRNTYLLFPDTPRGEGEAWARNMRKGIPPNGAIVTKRTYRLARVSETSPNPLASMGEWLIEGTSRVELDDTTAARNREVFLRIDGVPTSQRLLLDGRGLRLEEEIHEMIEVTETGRNHVKLQKADTQTLMKLVELKDTEKK